MIRTLPATLGSCTGRTFWLQTAPVIPRPASGLGPAQRLIQLARLRGAAWGLCATLLWCGCQQNASQGMSGVTYQNDTRPARGKEGPWSIHILKISRTAKDLELHTMLAGGTAFGLSTLSEQIQALPKSLGQPLAAINGDFYNAEERSPYRGDPRGLQILNGELVSAPSDQASFWFDASGQPRAENVLSELRVTWPDGRTTPLGLNEERTNGGAVLYTASLGASTRARGGRELILERADDGAWLPLRAGTNCNGRVRAAETAGNTSLGRDTLVLSLSPGLLNREPQLSEITTGAMVRISTATTPALTGATTAISGGSVLIREGRPVDLGSPQSGDYKFRSMYDRHPRSAIGASRDHIFLVQVDGRQPGFSMGMTLAELADYMLKLGCELAMNLDGGASSTFWFHGQVMNSPCNGGERGIANSVILVRKPKEARR